MEKRTLFIIIAAISVLLLIGTVKATDGTDAAGSAVSEQQISVYTNESESFSKVAYVGTQLPESTQVPGLVKTADDMWYFIDTGNSKNGQFLTYGDLDPAMTEAQMKADLMDRYGSVFTIFQVSFKVSEDCNVSYNVETGGTAYSSTSFEASAAVEGFDCSSFTYAKILVGGTSAIPDDDGVYTLNIKCDGVSLTSVSATLGDNSVTVSGMVIDSSDVPVSGATVRYSNSNGTTGAVLSDDGGNYSFIAYKGDVVRITSVEKGSSYTFPEISYNTGTLVGDYVFPDIVASEVTVNVRVLDSDGNYPISNAKIGYVWCTDVLDPTTGHYSVSMVYSEDYFDTDTDGYAHLLVRVPATTYKFALYVYVNFADSETTFSYEEESLTFPGTDAHDSLFARRGMPGSLLSGMGNDFADLSDLSTIIDLRCNEYVVEAIAAGGLDGSAGGAPLTGVSLSTQWRYQVYTGSSTGYNYPAEPSDDFVNPVKGRAFIVDGKTGENGYARIAYTVPSWENSTDPNLSVFLYIAAVKNTAVFTFTAPVLTDGGSESLPDLVADYPGAIVLTPSDLETARTNPGYKTDDLLAPTYTVRSDQVAYQVKGTITGTDLPLVKVTYEIYLTTDVLASGSIYAYFPDPADTGTAVFVYSVPAGYCSRIALATEDGYVFGSSSHSFPNAMADQAWSTTLVPEPVPAYERETPAVIDTLKVTGLAEGDVVHLQVVVSGSTFSYTRTAAPGETELSFPILGDEGSKITSKILSADGIYFSEFSGSTAAATKMAELSIVTFSSSDGVPTLQNTLPSIALKVYANDTVKDVTTSADGTAKVEVPEGATVSFKYFSGTEEYSVTSAVMTDGIYTGRTVINLSGIIDPAIPVMVTITEELIALSSLYNEAEPVSKVLRTASLQYESGSTVQLTAPDLEGFIFSGWYFGNVCLSEDSSLSLNVEEKYDGQSVSAVYTPAPYKEPVKGIDSTTLMIGLVAIMIAIMCFAYVILNNRGY